MATTVVNSQNDPAVLTAGVDYTFPFPFNLAGVLTTDVLTGATVTARLTSRDGHRELLAAKALVNLDDGLKTMDLVILPVDSANWRAEQALGDVKVVLSGGTERNHGLFEFEIRRAITP